MTPPVLVNKADFDRVLAKIVQTSSIEWVQQHRLDPEAIGYIGESAVEMFIKRLTAGETVDNLVFDTCMNGFLIGWEIAMEFGSLSRGRS